MAAGDPTVGVNFDANAEDLAAQIDAALQKILAKTARDISKVLAQIGREAAKNVNTAQTQTSVKATTKAANELRQSLKAIGDTTQALQGQFGKSFDPRNVAALDDQLRKLAVLQQKLKDGAELLGDVEYDRLSTELKAVSTGVIATRESFLVAARAAEEMRRNIERNARQASRVQVQESKAATGRYVVDAQSAAAAARDSSRQQIEATKAASRQRVAIIQATARTIATIERGLRTVFETTARAISGAFKGVGNAVSGVASGISRAFSKSSSDVTNNISNSYSKTFKNATKTVQNETNQQTSIIKNFSREATASINSIGTGVGSGAKFGLGAAVGGILGVGFAKALSGGFQRATILENSERALTKLLGTAEKAKALLTDVTDVVTGTPFALDQFASAATQLLAFNVEAEKIPEVLRTIADAASLSLDPGLTVDRLVRTFGQIQAAGKLATEDINQLTEAGVPAWALLGNQLGKTTLEMRELVTEGAVPASQAIDLLLNGIQNGTEGVNGATVAFAGLSKELGTTLKGSVSNFFTSISRLGANIITAFREPFTAALGAATAAVDLLGSALKALATEVSQSAAFQAIQRGLVGLTKALKEAKTALAPFFEFISGGIVLLGQFAAALFLIKRIPGALSAIGSAFKFILAPQRLLIAGGVLLASYFKKLYDDSVTLRDGISEVAKVLGRIATVIKDLVVDSFEAVTAAFKGTGEATSEAGSTIKGVLRPALERLASFLENTVLPAVRNFAKTMREDVLPFVGTALAKAVTFAKDAFNALVEFIRSEVIPVVGPILSKAVDVARQAFEKFYNFIADKLVPFIQANLLPVLAGVGTALGVLALSGGNIPLAGLAGLTAGIVAVLSDEEIRNALVTTIEEAVKKAQEALKGLFDGVTVSGIIKGALRVANQIGKVLGDIASDRRLLAALGAIAAGAVALGAAFVAGFVEGIINNIPELVDGLTNALEVAFEAAVEAFVDAPLLTKALVAAFAGVGVLAAIAAAGRKVGQTFQKAATFGPTLGTAPSNGASGFVSALFGGPGAIERQVAAQVAKTETQLKREFQRLQRVALQATGDYVRGAEGQFLKTTDARGLTAGMAEIERSIGKTNLAAAKLRAGIGQVGDAFRKGTPFLTNFSDGLRSIGQGITGAGLTLGETAGVIAGGAFAASFVSQAIFDINSSGLDKLQAGVGLAASAITVGAIAGAPAGIAVAGFGLLTSKLNANKVAADNAKEAIKQYTEAIKGADSTAGATDALAGLFDVKLADASTELAGALYLVGFNYEAFVEAVRAGNLTTEFEGVGEVLNMTKNRLEELLEAGDGPSFLQRIFDASGGDIDVVIEALRLLGGEADALDGAFERVAVTGGELGDRAGRGMEYLREQISLTEGATEVATAATQAYRDKLTELNDIRIQGLEDKVNDARDALNEAGSAADAAKEKLRQFLSGETTEVSAEQKIRDAVIAADSLGDSVANIDLNGPLNAVDTSNFETAVGEAQALVGGLLADAKPADPAALAKLVDPLKQAISESDASPEVQGWLQAGIDNAIAAYQSTPGQSLVGAVVDQEAENTAAQTVFDTALRNLKVGEALPADLFILNTTAAETAAQTAAQDVIDGWVEKLDGNTEMQDALKAQGEAAIKDFLASVGTNSPSTITKQAGKDVAQGFINGLSEASKSMQTAGRVAGSQAMLGVVLGLASGSSAVYATIRNIGQAMITALRAELKIESPSKVTEEIGEQTVEGFIKGIDESLPLVQRIAFSATSQIVGEFASLGTAMARAIGTGFAEEGPSFVSSVASAMDDALKRATTKADQFKAIGNQIARNLFSGQGTNAFGASDLSGGGIEARLQAAYLDILASTRGFGESLRQSVETATAFFGGNTAAGRSFGASFDFGVQGEENRAAFLKAGLNIRDYVDEVLASGRSVDVAADAARFQRNQLIQTAQAYGATSESIAQLITQLGLSDTQIADWVRRVNEVSAASAAAASEAERAIANQIAAEKAAEAWQAASDAAEDAARAAEEAARDAADRAREEEERRRREYTLQQPVFRDLIIQSPSGDPEAVALAAANRVAFSIRR